MNNLHKQIQEPKNQNNQNNQVTFYSGIDWALHVKNYNELCVNAREKVVQEFDSKVVARKYVELYEEIVR